MSNSHDSTNKALACAFGAALVLPFMDSIIKQLVLLYPVVLVAWVRLALMSTVLGLIAFERSGTRLFRPNSKGIQTARAVFAVVATTLFYCGLSQLPLGESTAIMCLAAPIAVLLSWSLLDEPANWRQWGAIAISFIGVMLVLRPGGGLFSVAALLPLGGALAWAGFMICSRAVGRSDDPQITTFWTSFGGCLLLTPFLPYFWPTGVDLSVSVTSFIVIGLLGALGQLLTSMAYQFGATPLVAPVGYASIGVAVLIGWWRFGDQPDLLRLIGIFMIGAGGVIVVISRHKGKSGEAINLAPIARPGS